MTGRMTGQADKALWERVEAAADPVRFALLDVLAAGPADARSLAERSGLDLGKVRYLLRRWRAAGIVEGMGGGTIGRRYRLRPGALFVRSAEAAAAAARRLNEARSRQVGLMMRQAMAIADEGMFGVLADHAALRLPLTVDPAGRADAVRLTEENIESVIGICEAAQARLGDGEGVAHPTTVAIGFFGRPQVRHSLLDRIDLAELAPRGRGPRNIALPGGREDPLRFEIEYQLILRPHTVAELAEDLEVSPSSVRRALRTLEGRGAVTIEATRPTRGTVERRWVGDPRAKYRATIMGRPGDERRKSYERRQVRLVAREMLASARAGELGGPGSAFMWLPAILDDRGLSAVHDEMAMLAEATLELRRACLDRRAWESADPSPATVALMLFRHR